MRLLLSHSSYITTQGALDDGTTPRNAEVPLVAAIFALREAIYAFPNGSTKDEYVQWLLKMGELTVSLLRSQVLIDHLLTYQL